MTYDSLIGDVQAYLERGGVTDATVYAQIPKMINLAERRLGREVKQLGQQTAATSTFTASSDVLDKPDRWRETISINVGTTTAGTTRQTLFPRAYEFIRTAYPSPAASTGVPKFYADYDFAHWVVAPTPSAALPFEAVYYANPAYLDATNQQNWWTDYAPDALLYGTLLEGAILLGSPTMRAEYGPMYDRALASLNGEEVRRISDRTTQRQEG